MTREEAIKDLHHLILKLKQADGDDRVYEHYKEVIEILQMEPCEDAIHREREQSYMQGYEDASKNFRREYSEDCISRQAVLSEIETVYFSKKWSEFRANYGSNGTRDYIINYIKQMPSVHPEPNEGSEADADKEEINPYEKCKTCGQNMESCCGCPEVLELEQQKRKEREDKQ